MDFEERFQSMAQEVDSFVVDGKIYVEREFLEMLNRLIAEMAYTSWPLWSSETQNVFAMMVEYYGGFNKMLLGKHAGQIVPDDLEEL